MNASKPSYNQRTLNLEQNKAALLSLLTFVVFGFLVFAPQYLPGRLVATVLGVVPALYMTWYMQKFPDTLRNGRGSLGTAIGLVTFLWIVAIASVVAITAGAIE